jgi:ribose transport system ATP-binding protein
MNDVRSVDPRLAAGPPTLAELENISVTFSRTTVLKKFSLRVRQGEIHMLLGANGAGKSTLIKVLAGIYPPDHGAAVRISGREMRFGAPREAYRAGCRFVHQDLGLIEDMSVVDNLLLGHYPSRLGTVQRASALTEAETMLEAVGLDVDPNALVSELTPAEKAGVAIARALRRDTRYPASLLILDEPTAPLPPDDVDRLLVMVEAAASNGVGVIVVTHHMDEVYRLGHIVTVLRDGVVVGRSRIDAIRREELAEMIAGESLSARPHRRDDHAATLDRGDPVRPDATRSALVVANLRGRLLRGVSFDVRAGEVVGIAGLTGSGREFVLEGIFDGSLLEGGEVFVDGMLVHPQRPDVAMAAGIGFLPAERKVNSGIMALSARENLLLTYLVPFRRRFGLHTSAERAEAKRWFERLEVKPAGRFEAPLEVFSGGNQQKILLAKWLRLRPKVLLLSDPSQGVDVMAQVAIQKEILAASEGGAAVAVSSSDFEELAAVCDRVLIMHRGKVARELVGPQVSQGEITRAVMTEHKEQSASPAAKGGTSHD